MLSKSFFDGSGNWVTHWLDKMDRKIGRTIDRYKDNHKDYQIARRDIVFSRSTIVGSYNWLAY